MSDITQTIEKSLELIDEQAAILTILKRMHELCEKNHILYSLHGGTLIGAIREHGFVPWDDDGDISLTRDEYIKFEKILRQEDIGNGIEFDITHRVPRLILKENGRVVAFVDVFIYDYIPSNKILRIIKIYLNMFFRSFIEDAATLTAAIKRGKYSTWKYKLYGVFQKVGALFPKSIPLKFFTFFNSKCLCGNKTLLFRSNDGYQPIEKWVLPAAYAKKYQLIPFEDTKLQVFQEYDKILTILYGDYMTPVRYDTSEKDAHDVLRDMI